MYDLIVLLVQFLFALLRRLFGVLLAFVLLCIVCLQFADAQSMDPTAVYGLNLVDWGKNAAAFAVPLALLVALLKSRIPKLTGYYTLGVTLALAMLGSLFLYLLGFLADPTFASLKSPLNWLGFGISAFIGASGGMAALQKIFGRPSPEAT